MGQEIASAGVAAHSTVLKGWWRDFFVCEGEELSWIHVDLSLREHAPVAGLPILVTVTAPLMSQAASWRVDRQEAIRLELIASGLERMAAPPLGLRTSGAVPDQSLRFVGRRTHGGVAELYFYSERPLDRRDLVEVSQHLPGAALRCSEREDPRWRLYLGTLHPGPALDPLLLTAVQLEERQRCGDDQAAPRAVDHLVRFRDPRDRQRFAELLRELHEGWDLRTFETDGERRFGLECTAQHSLDRWVIDPHVIDLAGRADELDGVYDGWGAPRVRGRRPPLS